MKSYLKSDLFCSERRERKRGECGEVVGEVTLVVRNNVVIAPTDFRWPDEEREENGSI